MFTPKEAVRKIIPTGTNIKPKMNKTGKTL